MTIPQITGLFDPQPYVEPKDATENNIATFAAMQDPAGALAKIQSDQILKSMTGLKLDGITDRNKQLALDAIKGYTDKSKALYNSQSGMNRLTLGANEQLQEDNHFKGLLTDMNSLKEAEQDYKKTMDEAATDFKNGTITAADYAEFSKDIEDRFKNAKKIGDVPLSHAVYNNYLTNKPVVGKLKDQLELNTAMFALYKQWNYTEGGTKKRDPVSVLTNIENSFPTGSAQWASLDNELTKKNFYPAGLTTEAQKKDFLTTASISGYNPKEGSTTTNNYNQWGIKNEKELPFVVNPDGTKSWPFQGSSISYTHGPVKGYLFSMTKGTDGKFYGEMAITKENTVPDATLFSSGVKKVVDRLGNTVYAVPLDAADYGEMKRKGFGFENGTQEGVEALGQQRQRTSKAPPAPPAAPAVAAVTKINGKDISYNITVGGKPTTITKQKVYDLLQSNNPGQVITEQDIQAALANYGHDNSKNPKTQ